MSSGFGLLEILAALTVLSISMLALVNGLLNAQQHGAESLWLTHAGVHAENLYERMLSNPLGTQQGGYYQTSSTEPTCQVCTPYEQATKDITQVQQQLNKTIPENAQKITPWVQGQEIQIQWPSIFSTDPAASNEWIIYVGSR